MLPEDKIIQVVAHGHPGSDANLTIKVVLDLEEHCHSGSPHPVHDPGTVLHYLVKIDEHKYETTAAHQTGCSLLALTGKEADEFVLEQVHTHAGHPTHTPVQPDEVIDLSGFGVERFVTKPVKTTIYVNGTPHQVTKKVLSFSEIVALAHLVSGPNVSYTLTHRKGPVNKPEGSMVEGDSIQVKEGMIFNVGATDRS